MTINTDADVIRVIRRNPGLILQAMREDEELLADMRRAILTDELLSLPDQFAETKATQEEMLETQNKILATQAEMLKTQNRLLADLAETRRVQAEMLETQNRLLADLSETRRVQAGMLATQNRILAELAELRKEQNQMSGRLGNLDGSDLERKLARIAPSRLCQKHQFRRPQILMSEAIVSQHLEDFLDELGEASFAGTISDTQYRRITDTDMILRVRRREDGETVHCAVEASSMIDRVDVTRAMASSDALHAVYGGRTMPVVLGYQIINEARELAEDNSVSVIIVNRSTRPIV